MEYNYEKLFPKLADGKGGTDPGYGSYIDQLWNEEYVKVPQPWKHKDDPIQLSKSEYRISESQWKTYKNDLEDAAAAVWAIADAELVSQTLNADIDRFPNEVVQEGNSTWGDEKYEKKVDYWRWAHDDVISLEKNPKVCPTHRSRSQNKYIISGLAKLFQPLAEYCSPPDKEASIGDQLLSLILCTAVLAVSLWLIMMGRHAEFGEGFILTLLKILFFPLLLVAIASGILWLIGAIGLLRTPGKKRAYRRRRERLAKKIDENRDTITRRLAYYHLWIDSDRLSEEGKDRAQETVATLVRLVNKYDADRAEQNN